MTYLVLYFNDPTVKVFPYKNRPESETTNHSIIVKLFLAKIIFEYFELLKYKCKVDSRRYP